MILKLSVFPLKIEKHLKLLSLLQGNLEFELFQFHSTTFFYNAFPTLFSHSFFDVAQSFLLQGLGTHSHFHVKIHSPKACKLGSCTCFWYSAILSPFITCGNRYHLPNYFKACINLWIAHLFLFSCHPSCLGIFRAAPDICAYCYFPIKQ